MKPLRNLLLGAGAMGLGALLAVADEAPKPPPQSPEIWVPTGELNVVLSKSPQAVMLSREQYDLLMSEAGKTAAPVKEPPRRAVLSSAHYSGVLNGDVLDVQAEFTVNVLSDNSWAQLPLRLGALALGDVKFDGDAALSAGNGATMLVIRGKGEHKITAEFMLPVRKDSGVSSVQLSLPLAAAGLFSFDVPPDTQVDSSQPVNLTKNANSTTVSLPLTAQNDVVVSWHGTGDTQQGAAIVFQENSYLYSIDETRVQADLGIVLNAALGSLPQSFHIKIPDGSTPLQVVGNDVLQWTAAGNVLAVDLTPGDRKTTGIRVLLEAPTQLAAGGTQLPLPEVAGVRRSAGKFAVIGSRGVKIREIKPGEGVVQAEGIFDGSVEQDPQFAAGYGFAVQPAGINVTVEKVTPRFSADLDTLVVFKREAISIQRTVALSGLEGEIFEANFVLPKGEELISMLNPDDTEPDWKADETPDGTAVKIRFGEGLDTGRQRVFKITSRMEPPKWPGTDEPVAVGDLKIQGAEKINGYLALQAEQMFRLETTGAAGLEKRDGRTTPVRGDFAWFRRDTFQLQVKISRRAPDVQAVLLGYALPVDGALDVHGQLGFNILYSGVHELRVKVPAESAEQFYFDGPQIAERNRDGDTWTIVLQKEVTGWYPLKFHAVIPFDESKANFHVDVPDVEPLDVKQQAGTWAIEANTSTEVTFNVAGMNELDPLHAPALPDYQPRHHVIGVYGYLGGQHSLKLDGVKHEAAPILTAVADRLDLETVVSASGAERHKAVFDIRTVGDQFLDVTLPDGSTVWSLTVDDQALKPVAEKPGVVQVQLPATLDRTHETVVQLVYETRRREWKGSGGYQLAAPRLDARIPVLQSHWRVWLPDGFSYTAFDSNLQKEQTADATPLLLAPFKWLKDSVLFRAQQAAAALGPQDVGRLLAEADSLYNAGQYDQAYQRYDQVLSLDPGNAAARDGERKVANASVQFATEATGITGAVAIDTQWESAPRKYLNRENVSVDDARQSPTTEYIQNKLNRIIIPEVNFRDTSVRDAIEFLRQKSIEIDTTEPDPAKKGVNFVLNLDTVAGQQESSANSIAEQKITFSLTNIPLGEALDYVTKLAGLKFRIDPNAVAIVPLSENTDELITKEFTVPPGFLGSSSSLGGDATINALTINSGNATTAAPSAGPQHADAKDYLTQSGVQFPAGAGATYLPGSNKLVVRDTPENLNRVDQLMAPLGAVGAPVTVPVAAAASTYGGVNTNGVDAGNTRTTFSGGVLQFGNANSKLAGGTVMATGSSAVTTLGAGGTPVMAGYGGIVFDSSGAQPAITNAPAAPGALGNFGGRSGYGLPAPKTAAGLLPMKLNLDLDHSGRQFSFDGYYAAENVSFHYLNWWNEARRGWIWWIAGALAFFAVGGLRVWRKLLWGALALTFVPICVAQSFTVMCNALLVGWVTGFVLYQIATRLVFRRSAVEVAAI